MTTRATLYLLGLLTTVTLPPLFSGEGDADLAWPRWRGPHDSGSVPAGAYPTSLGEEQQLWVAELPGKGCSTPIVLGETILLTAPVDGQDALLAYDWDGKPLWTTSFGDENPGKHRNGSGSNASPVTDGDGIFVYFKSGTLAAVEPGGAVRWQTNLVEKYGKDTLYWDHGTSPVLTDKHVVMVRMHHGESWLAAFDKRTGELAWKVDRNYETPREGDHGYATPLIIDYQGKQSILVWGAQHLTIHRPADGEVVWSCGDFNPNNQPLWPSISTPVIVGDIAVINFGRNDRGKPRLHGIRLSGTGDVTETNHVWKRTDVGTFVPSAVASDGRVYIVRDRGQVECIEPTTGETIWQSAFPKHRSNYYASPLIAGDLFYAPREDGTVFVARLKPDGMEVLSETDMGEPMIASPIAVKGRLFLRGQQHLYCLTKRK